MKGLSSEQLLVNVDRISDEGVIIKTRVAFDRFSVLKELCRNEPGLLLCFRYFGESDGVVLFPCHPFY